MVFEVLGPQIEYLFYPFFAVFLVWSLDRVANLYHLILECENATINMTVIHTSNGTEKKLSFPFHAINNFIFSLNRVISFRFLSP